MKTPGPPAERLQVSLLLLLIVGVPTVFLRNTFTTFDVPQLTLLWVAALGVLMVSVYQAVVSSGFEKLPRGVWWSSVFFVMALVVTTVLSDQSWVSFTGLTVRGAGALSYGLCLVVMYSVFSLSRWRSPVPLIGAFVVTNAIVAGYALVQAFGWDPFSWGKGELFVQPVFSTLGNPNFSAGYLASTLPLIAFAAFGSSFRLLLKGIAGGVLAAAAVALAYLGSFQGDVAALVAITVFGYWVSTRLAGNRLIALVIAAVPSLTVAIVPILLNPPGLRLLTALVIANVAAATAASFVPASTAGLSGSHSSSGRLPGVTRARVVGACSVMAGAAAFFWGRIVEELQAGFEQRMTLWGTSLSIFRSSPLVGTGLETYPAQFTTHRPRSHALEWEVTLSDSPHSVPLGFLSGGGLLLSLAYLVLTVAVGFCGVRAVQRSRGSDQALAWATFVAWCGYQIQASVSIDMPGLIYVPWVLAGVLVAGAVSGDVENKASDSSRSSTTVIRGNPLPGLRTGVAAMMSLTVFAGCLIPLTSPVRADLAAFRAQQALDESDLQGAGEALLRAIDLQPRNSLYRDGMALVYEESGLLDLAYGSRVRAVSLAPGNPYAAVQVARLALVSGRLDVVESWVDGALESGPHMSGILADSANILAHLGDLERASGLLEEFEILDSPNRKAWVSASSAYRALGEEESAARADRCASYRQRNCWPEKVRTGAQDG